MIIQAERVVFLRARSTQLLYKAFSLGLHAPLGAHTCGACPRILRMHTHAGGRTAIVGPRSQSRPAGVSNVRGYRRIADAVYRSFMLQPNFDFCLECSLLCYAVALATVPCLRRSRPVMTK